MYEGGGSAGGAGVDGGVGYCELVCCPAEEESSDGRAALGASHVRLHHDSLDLGLGDSRTVVACRVAADRHRTSTALGDARRRRGLERASEDAIRRGEVDDLGVRRLVNLLVLLVLLRHTALGRGVEVGVRGEMAGARVGDEGVVEGEELLVRWWTCRRVLELGRNPLGELRRPRSPIRRGSRRRLGEVRERRVSDLRYRHAFGSSVDSTRL